MAITFVESTKTFYLDGKNITYAFAVNEYGFLEHLYYGKRIAHDNLFHTRGYGTTDCEASIPGETTGHPFSRYAAEITFHGSSDYREPTVQVQNANGDRLSTLLYKDSEILPAKPKMQGMPSMHDGETLVVHLFDAVSNFGADLYYTVYDDCDVIARRVVYKNGADTPATLRRAYSFALSLPGNEYDAITLHGGWASERQIERVPLHYGVHSIDSKRTTSSACLNPFMAIAGRETTETSGEAFGISLIYSSSYVLKAEGTSRGETLLTGGINDFDFAWKLSPGEEFETPEVVIAFSDNGIGGMSRVLHDAFRLHLINERFVNMPRPVVLNSWEATYFDFNNERLMAIVDEMKGTGIDTFVLDDGWFGARVDDHAGLGDWYVNENKLEGGLSTIISHVNSLGMKFGLWFEPEMVNENSDLFRAHPDYAIGAPGRTPSYSRNQRVLDLTRKDVRDYIVKSVNHVLATNNIEYVKWDYNRNITESCSACLPPERQTEFAHRYALGLYDLCERIVNANPHVFFEGCSGGGARFDPGILAYFPQIWTSDCTDAEERTKIQYGTSIAYPLSAMSCHVSIVPNHQTARTTPLKTRAEIAHLGATGYELDTTKLSSEEKKGIKAQVDEYRASEDLLLFGDLYRLDNPFVSDCFTFMTVAKDKTRAKLTTYRRLYPMNRPTKRIRLAGLDPAKKYVIRELSLEAYGSTLMNVGFLPYYGQGDFLSAVYHIDEVK